MHNLAHTEFSPRTGVRKLLKEKENTSNTYTMYVNMAQSHYCLSPSTYSTHPRMSISYVAFFIIRKMRELT